MSKKHFYLTLDTETAGTLENPLVYDIGGAIHDRNGNIIETFSFVIYDIYKNKSLMQSAYYACKLPQYEKELQSGLRKMVRFYTARNHILNLIDKYDVKAVLAYNMRFDLNALNNTLREITNGKRKYFFPFSKNCELWCTWTMAKQLLKDKPRYKSWCKKYNYVSKNQQVKTSAEILHRWLTKNHAFLEEHTGLEDTLIEVNIFKYIVNQRKMRTIRKTYWIPKEDKEVIST